MTIARRAYAVRWKDSPRWDIKTAKATLFRLAHADFRPLADFAEEATEMVRPMDASDHEWPVYGVNNTEGVFLNQRKSGEKFNAPYKRIRKDWFFHNPTRANVGSVGRVPEVPDDAITSPEYQVWRLREGLLPEFVEILVKTRFFLDLIDYHRVGAVKQRLFVTNLLEIPIPDIPERQQRAIVSAWDHAQAEIADTRRRVAELEDEIEADFLADLGLIKPDPATLPKAFVVSWTDLQPRWGVDVNQQALGLMDPRAGKYPVVRLGEVIADLENGWSPKCLDRPTEGDEWGVLKMGAVSFGIFNERANKALPPKTMKPRPDLEVKPGDWLVSRANVTRLVGACALVRATRPRLMLCDKIFRAVWRNPSPIVPEYLDEIAKIAHLRQQIENNVTGTSATMKNITKPSLLGLRLPLPALPVQRQLVAKVTEQRQQIAALKAQAARKAQQTKADVEAMIVGDVTGREDPRAR